MACTGGVFLRASALALALCAAVAIQGQTKVALKNEGCSPGHRGSLKMGQPAC